LIIIFPASCSRRRRPQLPGPLKPRSAFGISDDLHVYACPQSLFKFHPDFDFLLEGILERDPLGVLVLVEARNAPWTRLLKDRLIRRLPQVHDRVKWLPRLSHDDFLQLCATSDVLLDTPHFNGGNTSYKAFAFGTPIVTLPSEFMRGRMTYGMYRKMDYLDCVAKTPEEYIALAVRLGTEREFRDATRAAILDNCGTLYEDVEVVREIEAFLRTAIAKLEKFE
jgi:protein O-GlcNAc transferase